jgi:hypothetical protein
MANNVRITELDFDTIKQNLKTYLKNQSEFTDYDFDASNLSVLVDLLAYNTHYNAVLANMLSNEMFLDTAIKRSSVVSLAKHLNYIPRSRVSAKSVVTVALQNVPNNPSFLTLEPYTLFTTSIDDGSYTFYNPNSYTTTPVNGVYTFENVALYQGRVLEYYYTVDASPGPADKYVIPNTDIDTATLEVAVQYGGVGSFSDLYRLVTDVSTIDDTARVYFLQENTQGNYEIFFGDDVIGRKLSQGDVVKVRYLITDGAAANVSSTLPVYWQVNAIAGEISNDRTVTTVSKPSGGADKEDVDTIRFRSINNYAAQGRAVTKNDYATMITDKIPGIRAVNIWGGENNDPPIYGKTFLSVLPKTGYVLTQKEKDYIINDVLAPRAIVTAQHEFVDPVITYLNFTVKVRYSSARTNRSADQIRSLVNTKFNDFISTNLGNFNAKFYRSQLEEQLMDIDDAILSINLKIVMVKKIPLVPNVRYGEGYVVQFPGRVHPAELTSNYFYFTPPGQTELIPSQLRDVPDQSPPDYDGFGTIKTFNLNTGKVLDVVGIVNYATGKITLNPSSPLTINGYIGGANQFFVYAEVQESVTDIFPAYNEILVQDDATLDTLANVQNGVNIDIVAVNE